MSSNKISELPKEANISIIIGTFQHAEAVQKLAVQTFQESHGHSASASDIQEYITLKFTVSTFEKELTDTKNIFHLIYLGGELAGYSKIIFNSTYEDLTPNDSAKLERLYVLEKFHDLKIGKRLMDFNLDMVKKQKQSGIWLYVWTENHRAIHFYEKYGFLKIAETIFQISERHKNPNWIMYLGL
jgi:ribosomal protein S18 acetylase RimI-like enzyme